jgi:hypothetical protein
MTQLTMTEGFTATFLFLKASKSLGYIQSMEHLGHSNYVLQEHFHTQTTAQNNTEKLSQACHGAYLETHFFKNFAITYHFYFMDFLLLKKVLMYQLDSNHLMAGL